MKVHGVIVSSLLNTPKTEVQLKKLSGQLTQVSGTVNDKNVMVVSDESEACLDYLLDIAITANCPFEDVIKSYKNGQLAMG